MNDLTDIQLDNIMSGIGIYDYYLEEDFGERFGFADRRRIPKGYYCELGRSIWSDIHQGAQSYMIDPIFVEKKSNPPGPVVKTTIKIKHSQVVYSPHSIQRFIQRGNKMPKLSELHLDLPASWKPSTGLRGVSNIMLPVKNGAFLGNLNYSPGFLHDVMKINTGKGRVSMESLTPTYNKKGEIFMRNGNLAQHHALWADEGIRYLCFHAETYVDYDTMNKDKRAIYDLHCYDPEASWNLQETNDNKRYYHGLSNLKTESP